MTEKTKWTVLGIETSCDETAAAIITATIDKRSGLPVGQILSNIVLSQIDQHAPFGGVVPEIAARTHIRSLHPVIIHALQQAGLSPEAPTASAAPVAPAAPAVPVAPDAPDALDAIAATAGPGLIGGLMVGLVMGKTLAMAQGLPFIGVNHLEAHALTVRLQTPVPFPYLLLLISGGHCQLVQVNGLGRYDLLGTTLDDAVGEAFDKGAKLLGLAYPGGPQIERKARGGNARALDLPRPLIGDGGCDFSFSGLKTALQTHIHRQPKEADDRSGKSTGVADIAASFQAAITDCLCERTANAMQLYRHDKKESELRLVIAGGVAANQSIRQNLQDLCQAQGFQLIMAAPALCTDNAAMIAWAGAERLLGGQNDPLDMPPRARWSLTELSPP